MKKTFVILFSLLVIMTESLAQVTVTGSSGADATYPLLSQAFTAINATPQTGNNIVITINGSFTEPSSATLNAGAWATVSIYPVNPGITISGNIPGPLLDLNGADNVTFDGRVNGSGTTIDLVVTNTSTSGTAGTSTIRFRNGATGNFIEYCTILGSSSNALSGIILFHTTTTNGNSGNTINNNNITSTAPANRPVNAVYSLGSSGNDNNNNTISNNNIYDFLNRSINSNGIFLSANNSSWTISGNSFYETSTFAPSASVNYSIIRISNTPGGNFSITGNFLGGSLPSCGGSAWTKTNSSNNLFTCMSISVSSASISDIQGNTLSNFDWRNSGNANWTGIEVTAGNLNIGTTTGNTIGSSSGTGSILVSGGTTGGFTYGIKISSTGTINTSNNSIGSITTSNSGANAGNIFGIDYSAASGSIIINNNTIGSNSASGSINASSASTGNPQYVSGINSTGAGTITISNNIIANLVNGTTSNNPLILGQITGITSTRGVNTISGNSIHDLTIGNTNQQLRQNASVCGIALSGTTTQKTISGNTIYNLSNTAPAVTGTSLGVIGLYFEGGTAPENKVSENFIHSLSVSATTGSTSLFGIRIASGATTYSNNIISIGGNTASTIYGFYETGAANNNNTLLFNTVFISGAPTSGGSSSFALFNAATTNIRVFKNNVFVNARSNNGATGRHYAIRLIGTRNLEIDYNDYFAPGNGGTLGSLITDRTTLAAWQSATGQDQHSLNIDPLFASPGGTTATDYRPGVDLPGTGGTGIDFDFGMNARDIVPTMGAWERPLNKWKGSATSSLWSLASNWTQGVVPVPDANIYFDPAPLSNCRMDGDKSVTNIVNSTNFRVETNGFRLTVKGSLTFSNGATIDASAANSIVEFAGTTAQSIPTGAFYNNQVFNLNINNSNNVVLNGTLNLLNILTASSGLLDATTTSPTLIYGGLLAQTLNGASFLNGEIYNMVIDNNVVVTINSTVTVTNSMTINPSRRLIINPFGRATVNSLVNNGILNLNSASSAEIFSLLIDSYSGSGVSNIEFYLTGGGEPYYRWHYIAPPQDNLPKTFFTDVNEFNLLAYDDSRVVTSDFNGWSWHDGYGGYPGIAAGGEFTTLSFGRGYNFYNETDAIIQLNGMTSLGTTLNTFNLQYSGPAPGSNIYGYNLLGNSLTCSLDWDLVSFNGPVNQAVYYTTGNRWATYLQGVGGTNGGTNYIPPLQGFFVKANDDGGSVDLSGARVHSYQPRYKNSGTDNENKKSEIMYPKVKLELVGSGPSDETIIWYNSQATTSYDEKFDAYKLFASDADFNQIYSILEGTSYSINGVPMPADSSIIPLGIKSIQPGEYTILKKDFYLPEGFEMFLLDKTNNVLADLRNTDEYKFTSAKGTFTDRFALKFVSLTTGIEDPSLQDKEFNIYSYLQSINIIPLNANLNGNVGIVNVYDLTGKIIKQIRNIEWHEGNILQIPFTGRRGIFLVEVYSGKTRQVGKVVFH